MKEVINSMLVQEYLQVSKNTMPTESKVKDDLYHGSVGIMTEIDEFKRAFTIENQIEELGDVCFYLALIHRRYQFKMFDGKVISNSREYITTLMNMSCIELLDSVKAHNEYGRDTAIDIQRACSRIGSYIKFLATNLGYSIERVMEINYLKLQGPGGRFEGGYTDNKANNRDLEKESNILKDNV